MYRYSRLSKSKYHLILHGVEHRDANAPPWTSTPSCMPSSLPRVTLHSYLVSCMPASALLSKQAVFGLAISSTFLRHSGES